MCNPWKKDFYLDTPGSFDLVFTLLESTILSKLSYITKKNQKKLGRKKYTKLTNRSNNDENKI
jgi:hypothetical protein